MPVDTITAMQAAYDGDAVHDYYARAHASYDVVTDWGTARVFVVPGGGECCAAGLDLMTRPSTCRPRCVD